MPKSSTRGNKKQTGGVQKYQTRGATPRNFGIGNAIQPQKDLTRFVKWPVYIRKQRQKRVLMKRLKVPPPIAQFSEAIDSHTAHVLFKFLENYQPESRAEKKQRLREAAKDEASEPAKKPVVVKYGLNHVTGLIESKKARLVIIAHDVDPVELVMWIPTLCRKMDIPYLIVKGKARLGKIVHKKTSAVLALVDVLPKDQDTFEQLRNTGSEKYLNRYEDIMTTSGGKIMGYKNLSIKAKKERAARAEKKIQGE